MPSESKQQARFFEAMKNNPSEARTKGIKKSTVNDWVAADRATGTKQLPKKVKSKNKPKK